MHFASPAVNGWASDEMSAVNLNWLAALLISRRRTVKTLLTSRKFWTLILALLVLIVAQFVPSFSLDEEAGVGMLIVLGTYMVDVAIDPGNGWKTMLQSRKFWAALVGFVVMVLGGFGIGLPFGLTQDVLIQIATAISLYMTSVAIEGRVQPKPISEHDVKSWG